MVEEEEVTNLHQVQEVLWVEDLLNLKMVLGQVQDAVLLVDMVVMVVRVIMLVVMQLLAPVVVAVEVHIGVVHPLRVEMVVLV